MDEKHSFEIGEDVINEGIAFIIENTNSNRMGKETDLKLVPFKYQILMELMRINNYSLSPFIIIADISLQHPFPGFTFFNLIKKYEQLLKTFPKDNINYGLITQLQDIYFEEMKNPQIIDFHNYLIGLKRDVAKSINDDELLRFFLDKYNFLEKRIQNKILPHYIFTLFDLDKIDAVTLFKNCISHFPPPLIQDDTTILDGSYVFFYLENHPDYMQKDLYVKKNLFHMGLHYLFNYLYSGNIKEGCSIYNFCIHEFKNQDCINNPINLGYLENTCELGMAIKFMKFFK